MSKEPLVGRWADPARTLGTDPRTDPRLVEALTTFGLDDHAPPPSVTTESPRAEQLEIAGRAEANFEALFAGALHGVPPVAGITRETITIPGPDGNQVRLFVHRPAEADRPLPGVVHLHGGGMVILSAAGPCYTHWRDELAASGLVVVGVEFRNGAGILGPHPFPAGLDDCITGLRWTATHLEELGASHIVVSGESGGANLTLATTLRAKQEGWLTDIAGVYAQCPYISNLWTPPAPELPSLRENDGYFVSRELFSLFAEVYDPGGKHHDDPTCWPYRAARTDLEGLPPHVISVNEVDPLRDEGLHYHQRLLDAGTSSVERIVAGTCHAGDVIFRAALPDLYAATIHDITAFARSLG